MIREADVFQLFWSRNSMGSTNVRQEWEYALSLHRPNFVRPTYWEFPMPRDPANGLPPPALSALHFQRLAVEPVADTAVVAGSVDSPQVSYPPVEINDEKAAASPSPQPPSPPTAKPVIICGNCGYKNDAAEVFCGSCGQFLAWVGQEVGASAAEPTLPPAAADEASTAVPPPADADPDAVVQATAPPSYGPAARKPSITVATKRPRPAVDTSRARARARRRDLRELPGAERSDPKVLPSLRVQPRDGRAEPTLAEPPGGGHFPRRARARGGADAARVRLGVLVRGFTAPVAMVDGLDERPRHATVNSLFVSLDRSPSHATHGGHLGIAGQPRFRIPLAPSMDRWAGGRSDLAAAASQLRSWTVRVT